jgi:2-phospho-L-lactate/phosphoenolpyruvate guanylyltransferase
VRWTVVIPAKALPAAKSRLVPASATPAEHRQLVEAIRGDTIAAARAADGVARVLVVVDRPGSAPDGVEVLVQTVAGLNEALAEAAAYARDQWPGDGVAALVGDLPALTPADLADALAAAAGEPSAFVADAPGTGTTLLTARPGELLAPRFGEGSAARHGEEAARIDAAPGLRHDVDTVDDLAAAAAYGLGPRTGPLVAARSRGGGMMGR